MVSVEFLKPWNIYSVGDVAGFEADQAQRLIEGKVAKAYEAEAKPPEAETKPAEAEAKPARAAK